MKAKNERQFLFEVRLKWLKKFIGKLSEKNISKSLRVSIPPAFGGKSKLWSPESLFLGSISASFMCTFLAYIKKLKLKILHLECDTIGQIEVVDGIYKFTNINVYPRIYINNENDRQKTSLALEKTNKHCIIINSTNAEIIYHSSIVKGDEIMEKIELNESRL